MLDNTTILKKYENGIIKPEFSKSFFEDEVREGFYISGMMKRYWASQLTVLSEIAKVCQKHGLRWFADCGTLLGAVRHAGYVPWDDDIDICMFREDWNRFFYEVSNELPEGYHVITRRLDRNYIFTIGRVVSNNTICTTKEYLDKNHGCPYPIGIDIYPLDGIAADEKEEEERCARITRVQMALQYLGLGRENEEYRQLLHVIEEENGKLFTENADLEWELRCLEEELMQLYPAYGSQEIAMVTLWHQYHNHRYQRELYDHTVYIPFETTYIPVPARYEEVLRIVYGEYMTIRKGRALHDYPIYSAEESLLEKRLGHHPYRYTWPDRTAGYVRTDKSFIENCRECVSALRKINEYLFVSTDIGSLLETSQDVAVCLGNLIEDRMRQDEKVMGNAAGGQTNCGTSAVHLLEGYCEILFELFEQENKDLIDGLVRKLDEIDRSVEMYLSHRKKIVVFLNYRPEWWASMEKVWIHYIGDADNYVIKIYMSQEQLDLQEICPDKIVFQYPFGEENAFAGVSDKYYPSSLMKYTECLEYCPFFCPDLPAEGEEGTEYSWECFFEQPAFYYADRVLVDTEKRREFYIEQLDELSGMQETERWQQKIVLFEQPENCRRDQDNRSTQSDEKKVLLYEFALPTLLQYRDDALRKLRESLDLILEQNDLIKCIFVPHISLNWLKDIDVGLWKSYREVLENYSKEVLQVCTDADELEGILSGVSAYYGEAGVTAHRCRRNGVPVMIGMGRTIENQNAG